MLCTMPVQMNARWNAGSCAYVASDALSLHLWPSPPCLQLKGECIALVPYWRCKLPLACLRVPELMQRLQIVYCNKKLFKKCNKGAEADLRRLHADPWQTGCFGSQPPWLPAR